MEATMQKVGSRPVPDVRATMKALVHDKYGSPQDVLEIEDVETPEAPADGVLVRVQAASLNRLDWYGVKGRPLVGRVSMGFTKPKGREIGVDFAGTVESVGPEVTDLQPGDEVFGGRSGAFAEFVPAAKAVARKPSNMTFEEASCLAVAGVSALQGLRDKGQVKAGQHVLINGASGGVGTFAVQIAKALGAEVTAVCSTRNVEQSRTLGADHVIGAERSRLLDVPRAADGGYLRPERLRDLDGERAHAAGGAVDEDLLSRLELPVVPQALQGREGRHGHGGRLLEGQVCRLRCDSLRRAHVLGERPALPAEDVVTGSKVRDVLADGLHRSGEVDTGQA